MRRLTEDGEGDCYIAALSALFALPPQVDVRLVHATVTGQGPLEGQRLGHAWIEIEKQFAIDMSNGRIVALPAEQYREIGQASDVHEYTPDEAQTFSVTTGHAGPWEN